MAKTPKLASKTKIAADKKRLAVLYWQYKAASAKKEKDAIWAKMSIILFD